MTPSEPIPAPAERTIRLARAWRRYRRVMLAAAVAAPLLLLTLKGSGVAIPLPLLIATLAGFAFAALVGTGLIGLVYMSGCGGRADVAQRSKTRGR
jgi:xanthine/uracil permease